MKLFALAIFFLRIRVSHAQTLIPGNTTCPPGYFKQFMPTNKTLALCTRCEPGYYTMQNKACAVCPEGLKCHGGNNVSVLRGWGVLPHAERPSYLVTRRCPPGWCCPVGESPDNTCPYTRKDSLCGLHRNPSVPFCGACLPGFAETVIDSPSCAKCNRLVGEFFFFALIMGFVLCTLFMVILNANHVHPFYTYYWKILVYFYQIIPFVSIEVSMQLFGPLISVTSLDWVSILGFECLHPSLDAISRLWVAWFISFILILQSLFVRLVLCREYGCKNPESSSPDDPSNIQMTRQELQESHMGNIPMDTLARWTSSFWFLIVNIYGIILPETFGLSDCRIFPTYGIRVWYAGAAQCFSASQYFAWMVLLLLFAIPFVILYKLYRANTLTRITCYSSLTNTFQDKYYYWETVLLLRRFFIIFLRLGDIQTVVQTYVITTLLGVCLGIQFYYYPFVDVISNRLEVSSLFVLFMISLLNVFAPGNNSIGIVVISFALLPLLPIPWLIYKYHLDKGENTVNGLKEIGVDENILGKKLCDFLTACQIVEDDNACVRIGKTIGATCASVIGIVGLLLSCCCCCRLRSPDDETVKPRTGRLHSTSGVGGGVESGLETVN